MTDRLANIGAPELRSERLVYRDIREEDAETIVRWRSDPEVYRYFNSPHKITLEEHLNWFHRSYLLNRNRFDWIARSTSGERIGVFGVSRESEESRSAEVNYILAPEHYGKGYASEAIMRLVDFCRDEWRCSCVAAVIHRNNAASIRLAERLGFTLESEAESFLRYVKQL